MNKNCVTDNGWLNRKEYCVNVDETKSLKSFNNGNQKQKKISGPTLSHLSLTRGSSENTTESNCRTITIFTSVLVLLGIGAFIITIIYKNKGE